MRERWSQTRRCNLQRKCHLGLCNRDALVAVARLGLSSHKLKESLAKNSPGSVVHIYDGVGHGFMNSAPDKPKISDDVSVETGFPPAQKDVQQLAFERLEAFFAKHLKQ